MAGVEYDEAALARIIDGLAAGMDDLGQEAVGLVYQKAPRRTGRYRKSIGASTYAGGKHYAGRHLLNIARMPHADVLTVVYSSSSLAHLLERGTQPIDVDAKNAWPMHFIAKSGDEVWTRHVRGRSSPRIPHFGPAAIASVGRVQTLVAAALRRRMK